MKSSGKKQIIIAINAHGKELHDNKRLTMPADVNVRIFSTVGKIGVCSLAQEYEDGTSFNQAATAVLKKQILKLLATNTSIHSIITKFLSEYQDNYKDTVENFLTEMISEKETLEGKAESIKDPEKIHTIQEGIQTIDHHIREAEKAHSSRGRVYVPTHDKEYLFYSHAFIDVIYNDDVGLATHLTTMEFPDIISTFLEEGLRNSLFESINEHGYITLSQIIAIFSALGFQTINIIDFSCRDTSAEQSAIDKLSEEERATATNIASGIRRKYNYIKRKSRKANSKRTKSRKANSKRTKIRNK